MYVLFRAWRVNEGGTTDLPDYSEIVLGDQTLSTNLHGTPQWHMHFVVGG
jgi:hypothetical protein